MPIDIESAQESETNLCLVLQSSPYFFPIDFLEKQNL